MPTKGSWICFLILCPLALFLSLEELSFLTNLCTMMLATIVAAEVMIIRFRKIDENGGLVSSEVEKFVWVLLGLCIADIALAIYEVYVLLVVVGLFTLGLSIYFAIQKQEAQLEGTYQSPLFPFVTVLTFLFNCFLMS